MKILIAASEAIPYVKTGGLADVAGTLLKEYRKMQEEAYLILPLYRSIRHAFPLTDTGVRVNVPIGDKVVQSRIFSHESGSYFLECDPFFDRDELYGTPQGDYADNAARYLFFSRAVLEACMALGLRPDVIHCNDWQTGFIPLYLRSHYRTEFFSTTATVMTIHNLGYQGVFGVSAFPLTGLGWEWFTPEGVEFYGKVNFLKAGIISSDIITTVSTTYASEILTPEFGYGLDGVLRKRSSDLYGVINGIDIGEWDPRSDVHIPAPYDASDLSGKALCKKALIRECSLGEAGRDVPVIAMIGRFSEQKGLDIFLEAMDEIISLGVAVVILGKGDERFQTGIIAIAERFRGLMSATIGYDDTLARHIYAGSDLFLMPSQYEPCGLGQMISMRYGTLPLARRTGGLADSITDYDPLRRCGTGFLFKDYRASSLVECLKRALCVYVNKRKWKEMTVSAMGKDFSWERSAERYRELYQMIKGKK